MRWLLSLSLCLVAATPALAHIRVYPMESIAGVREKYVVRVPNEKQMNTVRVEGQFPAGLDVYDFEFKSGWTVTFRKGADGKITGATWTGVAKPYEFVEFGLLALNPKDAPRLVWTFTQVYADGTKEDFAGPVGSPLPSPVVTLKAAAEQPPQTPAPAGNAAPAAAPERVRRPPFTLTSRAWDDGGVMPEKYTQAAGEKAPSPALTWTNTPAGTRSFVVLVRDLDAVISKGARVDMTRWLIWNIPQTAAGLQEGVPEGAQLPDGSRQVSLRANAYTGPGAPAGNYHHYAFELYALDTMLAILPGRPEQVDETRIALVGAMEGHVLGKSVLVARFHR